MTDKSRLIERAFPLKQASLDSVHEKNVRHGHISTLHIWPARRPLAACRAALIATLLPDPGTPEERQKLCEKIGGRVVQKIEKKKMPGGRTVERIKEETKGGILHWLGSEPNSGGKKKEEYRRKAKFYEEELEWFRQQILKAYGGRAPRVLDPFAGGGAIPLEAMRLGCETTAVDINPVAWFILKCTLEYPQKLAGKTHPLPSFILVDEEFMAAFYKAHPHLVGRTIRTKKQAQESPHDLFMKDMSDSGSAPEADLAWHVRAWGKWVLDRARRELANLYPTYADFEPLPRSRQDIRSPLVYEKQPMRLVPLSEEGTPDIGSLNADFSEEYLADKRNPRWVAKPTVAYLWARTVTCKNCRSTTPLLKTRWLCKKANKRVLLTIVSNSDNTGVVFGIEYDVPVKGGNAAQKREHDKRIGAGTMSSAGVKCQCCGTIMTMEDLRQEGKSHRLGLQMTAVAVEGQRTKEQRLPTDVELSAAAFESCALDEQFEDVPFGVLYEPMPNEDALGMRAPKYGLSSWAMMFTPRQAASLARLTVASRSARESLFGDGYDANWREAISAYLACGLDRLVDFSNMNVQWKVDADTINHALVRFAIQMTWDFAEGNPLGKSAGAYSLCINRIVTALDTLSSLPPDCAPPTITHQTAECPLPEVDLIVTDPPYYDAIPYSDLMDWFYVWLRRHVFDLTPEHQTVMSKMLGPKWNADDGSRELIDDASRHGGDRVASKQAYEDGMATCFGRCADALVDDGLLVIVFANKSPHAWETLVAALIRSGFIVDGSWPIQTEQPSRMRGLSSAALASSVWLVCRKRAATAKPGWDNKVMEEMRANIATRLREFWDAGIRGPDFVWAATGPALEAYSKHPVVKMADYAGKTMEVGEFLSQVRRMVVDFVVGQVLTGDGEGADLAAVDRMDAPTAYYLLHRHDFGLKEAPSGACILYATACGLSDSALESTWDILIRTGGSTGSPEEDEENDDADPDAESDPDDAPNSGGKVKLKTWAQRKHKSMGYEAPGGQPIPLIDRIHRLMHLWRGGDVLKVDDYLDGHGLRRHELFRRLLQSLIELSPAASDERTLLESLSNHVQAKGATPEDHQMMLTVDEEN